jgi:hypothetical protein
MLGNGAAIKVDDDPINSTYDGHNGTTSYPANFTPEMTGSLRGRLRRNMHFGYIEPIQAGRFFGVPCLHVSPSHDAGD